VPAFRRSRAAYSPAIRLVKDKDMKKHVAMIATLAALAVVGVSAQNAKTGRLAVQAASTALGVPNLKSIQYTGSGWVAVVGQNYTVDDDWPRREMPAYRRSVDFGTKYSREEYTEQQGKFPFKGGLEPLDAARKRVAIVSADYAWNLDDNVEVPAVEESELRQLDMWLSPQGFLKAAADASARGLTLSVDGRPVTIVTFRLLGKYKVNGTINEQNLVERVQTWIPNPVVGDMLYEHQYSDYKDFGGIKFPTVIRSYQGDARTSAGHSWMEIHVADVQANVDVKSTPATSDIRTAHIPIARREDQRRQGLIRQIGDKAWVIAGGTHSTVVVEFKDFVVLIEAPVNEERSLWVLPELRKLVPTKPIKFVVNTHHHFDHVGGIRTYVAQGATIVTHESNRQFFEQVVLSPAARTLEPDIFSNLYPSFGTDRKPVVQAVREAKFTITDGARTIDVYPIQGLAHSGDMLIAYLPAEKILVNADLYSPPAPGDPPAVPDASMRTLVENIQRLGLQVSRHVPIHGMPASNEDLLKTLRVTQ
jgi:glyoxylase-like metal-dependent hydrolase (beta-lactamase superfamily II)